MNLNTISLPCLGRQRPTRGVAQCGLAIYMKKYLNAKEELWKLKYFIMKKYNLQKRNQNPSRYFITL